MALMSPADSAFLLPETREQPMHVGSLQLLSPPPDAGRDFLPELYHRMLEVDEVAPLFRRRAYRSATTLGQWAWADDRSIDLEHHVRHSALPRPGRIRELLALASRLHSTLLDRQRPLWEVHLVEGLQDGRFALYTKLHHALIDGVSGLRLLQQSATTDPDDRSVQVPFAAKPDTSRREGPGLASQLGGLPGVALGTAGEILSLGPALFRAAEAALREQAAAMPMQAPRTILNGPITGSRRFAAQSWPLERLKGIAAASGTTLNDVVLAMCAGALREYLLELDALPDTPLTAMVPVSLRSMGVEGSGGNAVGSIVTSLATDVADPGRRLEAIAASMQAGKDVLAGMNRLQVTALSALAVAPVVLNTFLPLERILPPPFNLVISNVPGPPERLYWNGARLDAIYPLSIPTAGQALNITVTSYAGSMEFGLTGCRRSVPHLQRLLTFLDASLDGLATAAAA